MTHFKICYVKHFHIQVIIKKGNTFPQIILKARTCVKLKKRIISEVDNDYNQIDEVLCITIIYVAEFR